ncbi:MAG: VOC family protein [Gemmatimonadetes bacterium]|nr:MAG: VOC family protein [Gemmatimonadota bacterium]
MANVINWFEIPVDDLDRAAAFYEAIFEYDSMYRMEMGGGQMAFFPMEGEGVGGALTQHEMMRPSPHGVLVYLNAGDDLAPILGRVEDAGGKIVMPKTQVTEEIGYIAMFIDTEGNRIGLHSPH